jgi:hypothetical protein
LRVPPHYRPTEADRQAGDWDLLDVPGVTYAEALAALGKGRAVRRQAWLAFHDDLCLRLRHDPATGSWLEACGGRYELTAADERATDWVILC